MAQALLPTEVTPVDSVAPAPPLLQVAMTPEDRITRQHQFAEDSGRARAALEALRGVMLSLEQEDQKKTGEKFLTDADEAFRLTDLLRACALAQKARIISEELKAQVLSRSP